MIFNIILVSLAVSGFIFSLYLNKRGESKRSFLKDAGGYEITNTKTREINEV